MRLTDEGGAVRNGAAGSACQRAIEHQINVSTRPGMHEMAEANGWRRGSAWPDCAMNRSPL